jgi:hypothetical protein
MSTLVAQTISNGTVSTSSQNVIQGSAKAWVNFNGVGGAVIRGSYNVSSVTRTSTGYYVINFTNALADTNYIPVYFACSYDSGSWHRYVQARYLVNPFTSASQFTFETAHPSVGTSDSQVVSIAFFR